MFTQRAHITASRSITANQSQLFPHAAHRDAGVLAGVVLRVSDGESNLQACARVSDCPTV